MALYLLNISVDAIDPNPNYIPENLLINDQESIVEIIIEKVLGYGNVIEEYDDQDHQNYSKKSKLDLIFQLNREDIIPTILFYSKKQYFLAFDSQLTTRYQQIDTPPPKA